MKRIFFLFLMLMVCVFALGQSSSTNNKQEDTGFMGWVHNAWKTVQEQGRPAAENLVKQFPKRFQNMKESVATLSKRAHTTIATMDLEQKRLLLLELWRLRKSLDLLTLLRPEVLQQVTGMDTSVLKSLEIEATHLTDFVTQKIHGQH